VRAGRQPADARERAVELRRARGAARLHDAAVDRELVRAVRREARAREPHARAVERERRGGGLRLGHMVRGRRVLRGRECLQRGRVRARVRTCEAGAVPFVLSAQAPAGEYVIRGEESSTAGRPSVSRRSARGRARRTSDVISGHPSGQTKTKEKGKVKERRGVCQRRTV
jgi:hypothetical protein